MPNLKEDYKDDILDTSQNVKRKYKMTDNGDGTVSLDDETVYTQEGDSFGASDMNATNGKVNALETDIGEINDNLSGFKFYPTGTGIVGLISDDSAYTDANGKYVIWGTATANQLVEDNPNTYKSVPSEEDTRGKEGADTATPFSKDNFEIIETIAKGYPGAVSINKTVALTGKKYILHTSITNGYGSISSVTSSFSVKLNNIELTPTSQYTDNSIYIVKNYIIENSINDTLTINIAGNGGAMGVTAYLDKIK